MAKMNFKDACLLSGGCVCPYCGKRNTFELDVDDSADEDDVKRATTECHDCGEEWVNSFRLEDVVEP